MANSVDLFEVLNKYCERTSEGVWAEPLNVISNIAFLIVAVLLFQFYRKNFRGRFLQNWDISLLILFLFFIALGSTLWHMFAVRLALYADVVPILLFINLFLVSCFIRVLRLSIIPAIILFILYQLFNYLTQTQFSMDTLNGSVFYLPVFVFLSGIALYVCRKQIALCRYYLISLGLFFIALTLRTFDVSQCDDFPTGTHFLWHILIAVMLYFLTKSLMINQILKTDSAIK